MGRAGSEARGEREYEHGRGGRGSGGSWRHQKGTMDQWNADSCQLTNQIIARPLRGRSQREVGEKVKAHSLNNGTSLYFMSQPGHWVKNMIVMIIPNIYRVFTVCQTLCQAL